jgi:hypothetical protein
MAARGSNELRKGMAMSLPDMQDIIPETFLDAVKALSPGGRDDLLAYLRTSAIQLSPADGEIMARIADVLELLLG